MIISLPVSNLLLDDRFLSPMPVDSELIFCIIVFLPTFDG